MKVTKKSNESFVREDAHGGSGGRKLLLADNEMKNVQGDDSWILASWFKV